MHSSDQQNWTNEKLILATIGEIAFDEVKSPYLWSNLWLPSNGPIITQWNLRAPTYPYISNHTYSTSSHNLCTHLDSYHSDCTMLTSNHVITWPKVQSHQNEIKWHTIIPTQFLIQSKLAHDLDVNHSNCTMLITPVSKWQKIQQRYAFQFSTRGHCIKGKQCHPITVTNNKKCLQSNLAYLSLMQCHLVAYWKVSWPIQILYYDQTHGGR